MEISSYLSVILLENRAPQNLIDAIEDIYAEEDVNIILADSKNQ